MLKPTPLTEFQEQALLFDWASKQCKAIELSLMFAIPNGGSRSGPAEGANFKRSGVRAGVPDLCLPVARGKFHGLFCEMKRMGTGKLKENQDMNILITIIANIIFFMFLFFLSAPANAWPAKVVSVHDGDTLTVQREDGKRVKVRLYGIDCPELNQPYGKDARGIVSKSCNGQAVDVLEYYFDPYKRSVCEITTLDGVNLNQKLVSEGAAWVDARYCKQDFCQDWKSLETQAMEKALGLWKDENAVPPWTWRRGKKK